MKALSAAKRLQQHTDRFDLLTDYATDPPKLVPASNPQIRKKMRPGGLIPVSSPTDADIIRSAWDVKADPSFLQAQIQQDYQQIRKPQLDIAVFPVMFFYQISQFKKVFRPCVYILASKLALYKSISSIQEMQYRVRLQTVSVMII